VSRGPLAAALGLLIDRLEGCQRDVEVWQRILQVRSLVLSPNEDMDTWIAFADLCRDSDRLNLAEKTLTSLVGNHVNAQDPEVRLSMPCGSDEAMKLTTDPSEGSATCHLCVLQIGMGQGCHGRLPRGPSADA